MHFYNSSGGNAGIACVHAANSLNRPSTIVVPLSTQPFMIAKIRAAGASRVVQFGATWRDADEHLRETVMKEAREGGEEAVYVPPFDHEDVREGNGTIVEELREQMVAAPDVVACSVGGGGLFAGIAQGIMREEEGWSKTTLLALETEGADSLAQSVQAGGEVVTLTGITSIAKSLGAVRVADRARELAFEGHESGRIRSVVLSDAEAAMGCWRFADDERVLVEPACGVVIALCYEGRLESALGRRVRQDENVVLIVCGGQNVSAFMVEQWRSEYGDQFGT